jgi:DNA-binding beta-propeller fold protein YncE
MPKYPASPTVVRVLAAILAGIFCFTLTAADKKEKKPAAPAGAKRLVIDTSNLVWPQPPAIVRVRFLSLYTGEKIDPALYAGSSKTKKRNWKDVLAGAQSEAEKNVVIPYQFMRVYGVAADSKGTIYAADQAVGAIFAISPEEKVTPVIRNGKEAGLGLINGLAVDDNDRIFVSDSKLRRVLVFNSKYQQEGTVGAGSLEDPGGIAIDRENRFLYVVDTSKDQVVVFDADSFKLLRRIGTANKKHTLTDPGNFALPTNVAVDGEGDVYVTDTLNDRVEIFDAEGNFITAFGKNGDSPGHFARPKGIAVDCDRHIWVVDEVQSRVQVFDREGHLLIYFGEQGAYPGMFSAAYGIAIDRQNRVIVSEQYPGRVQVFRYITDAEAEAARTGKDQPAGAGSKPPGKNQDGQAPPAQQSSAPAAPKSSAAQAPLKSFGSVEPKVDGGQSLFLDGSESLGEGAYL